MASLLNMSGAGLLKKGLLYDAEVEFLESTGTQWINTGVIFKKFLYLNFNAQYTANFSTTQVIAGPSANGGCWVGNASPGKWAISSSSPSSKSSVKSKVEIVYDNSTVLYVDGTSKGNQSRLTNPSNPIAIFNAYTGGFPSSARLYSFRIEDWTDVNNKIKLFDAIPVRIGTTGYLYDKISGQLFGNAGTGDFVLGNDIVEIDYLESSGTQVINTGIPVKDIGKYITCCQFENASTAKAEGSTETGKYYFIGKNAQNKYYAALNSTVVTSTISNDGAWHEFELDVIQGLFSIDGSIVNTLSAGYVNSNIKFALFACNGVSATEGNYSFHISGKKKWTKIYGLNGELILDFIPVRGGQVGYMRDKISGKLYGNSGTGSFTLGSDKT